MRTGRSELSSRLEEMICFPRCIERRAKSTLGLSNLTHGRKGGLPSLGKVVAQCIGPCS